jgi:hypothetical protein
MNAADRAIINKLRLNLLGIIMTFSFHSLGLAFIIPAVFYCLTIPYAGGPIGEKEKAKREGLIIVRRWPPECFRRPSR